MLISIHFPMTDIVTVRLSRQSWKELQSHREPNETLDEVLKRLLDDRRRFSKAIREHGGSTLSA